jgi:Uma2 family endonuclease
MTTKTSLQLTKDQYLLYDDGTDNRYEWEDGLLVEMPPESKRNNRIAVQLQYILAQYFPTIFIDLRIRIEVVSNEYRYRWPDLLVHTPESEAAMPDDDQNTLWISMPAPALVVEVVSPGDSRDRDYRRKHGEYENRGIPEYWIIDPKTEQITVCTLVNGIYQDRVITGEQPLISSIMPSFNLTANQILELGN